MQVPSESLRDYITHFNKEAREGIHNHEFNREFSLRSPQTIYEHNNVISHHISTEEMENLSCNLFCHDLKPSSGQIPRPPSRQKLRSLKCHCDRSLDYYHDRSPHFRDRSPDRVSALLRPSPLSFPSPLSLPPLSPVTVPLSFPSPSRRSPLPHAAPSPFSPSSTSRSPLSPSPTRRSPLPLAAPLSPLAVADSSFPSLPLATPLSPLAIVDSSFPSPSRCPPLVPLFQSAVLGSLQHPSPSHTHPPSLLFYFSPISFVRRDVDVHLEEKWLSKRDTSNDSAVLSNFMKELGQSQKLSYRNASIS
ncbi:hypothetical protein ACLOJK_032013, partial [Asimina triloba]